MKVAVVGATGLVGRVMLEVLLEFGFPITELIPVASVESRGKLISFKGHNYRVVTIEEALERKPDLALFSAGSAIALIYAHRFAETGTLVIDNSSALRLDPAVPLVVPEVNIASATGARIIANPNCSTIQLTTVLWPLHEAYGLERVVVSTYQSVSGTGKAAVDQLMAERKGEQPQKQVYPQTIDLNVLPHCDVFLDNGYTKEEMKLVNESRKIMGLAGLRLTATAVRVPVLGGHSEAVNVEFKRDFEINDLRELLANAPGIIVQDDPEQAIYPTPRFAHTKNEVFVGRIRRDESAPRSVNLWIVADNLRKGAATNAVQIAQELLLPERSGKFLRMA